MSMHEYHDVMYGVELPKSHPDNDKILAFINNHKDALSGFNSGIEFPKTADDVIQFIDYYEDECKGRCNPMKECYIVDGWLHCLLHGGWDY